MKIVIPVHSFIDIITNSSSETFVCPSIRTVAAAFEVIEALFNQAAHPGLKARDFFKIELIHEDSGNGGSIPKLVIEPMNINDPKQVAVANALKKLVSSVELRDIMT